MPIQRSLFNARLLAVRVLAALHTARIPLSMSGVLLALTALPYLLAVHGVPANSAFLGSLRPSDDESQYFAALRMGSNGDLLWHDPYMVQTPPAILMYPLYLVTGWVAGHLHGSPYAAFVALHLLAGVVLGMVVWRLGALALKPADRPWFVACALGMSGLYWLDAILAALGHAPAPLSHMGLQFLSGFTLNMMVAHESLAVAGQIMALTGLIGAIAAPDSRLPYRSWLYGACGTILIGLTLPQTLVLTGTVSLLFTGWHLCCGRRASGVPQALTALLAVTLPVLPFLLYYQHLFAHGAWAVGGFTSVGPPPPPEQLLFWFLLLPPAIWGWWRSASQARAVAMGLLLWCGCALLLGQSHAWQGGRLVTGLTIVLGMLFALGLAGQKVTALWRGRLLILIGAGAALYYLILLSVLSGGSATNLYATARQEQAMQWLAGHAGPRDVVLAPFLFSNRLPAVSNAHVVAGHPFQTLDLQTRQAQVRLFFVGNRSVDVRLHALRAMDATLVVYDTQDTDAIYDFHSALDTTIDPHGLPGLYPVYTNGEVTIFRVHLAHNSSLLSHSSSG